MGGRGGRMTGSPARVAVTAAVLVGALSLPALAQLDHYPEAAVEAEFIERFTRFVDWPRAAMPDRDQPFVLCVHGDTEVADYLDAIAADRDIKSHRVTVRRIASNTSLGGCQVLHLGRADPKQQRALLAETEGKPILTIAERGSSAPAGVMIQFYRKGSYLRFEIDAAAIAAGGLKARAKLLRLGGSRARRNTRGR